MSPTFPSSVINDRVLNEVAHSTVTLEPVLFFYGGLIAAAVVLWMIGAVTFGRSNSTDAASLPMATLSEQRVTPVVP